MLNIALSLCYTGRQNVPPSMTKGGNRRDQKINGAPFRGAAYIVKNQTVLYERVTGYADLPNRIPNTLETRFASASAGKVFVAVGILQLIDRGLLHFHDTIGEILTIDFHAVDPGVTVRQLLTHTSGVPDYFDESVMEDYEELWKDYPNYKIRRNEDLLPLFIHKPMSYEKGSRFQYNNSGYVLLAMIIEKITGMAFDEYLRIHLFAACGMTSTGYYELDKLPDRCAANYIYCDQTKDYRTNIYSVDAKGTGAGGAFITVRDIVSFWTGLLHGNLLSPSLTAEMLKKQSGPASPNKETYYGYGVWLKPSAASDYLPYIQGYDPGVTFLSECSPKTEAITVYVSNYGDTPRPLQSLLSPHYL